MNIDVRKSLDEDQILIEKNVNGFTIITRNESDNDPKFKIINKRTYNFEFDRIVNEDVIGQQTEEFNEFFYDLMELMGHTNSKHNKRKITVSVK